MLSTLTTTHRQDEKLPVVVAVWYQKTLFDVLVTCWTEVELWDARRLTKINTKHSIL